MKQTADPAVTRDNVTTMWSGGKFYPEPWMSSRRSTVYHISHPERDAWCGALFGPEAFVGVVGSKTRRCQRCMTLGGEQ